jgi:hypothetical protein
MKVKQENTADGMLPRESIERYIFFLRGQKVMLDQDLAELYGVETKILNKAVKRNLERFPEDFMFRLTPKEWDILRFQVGTSNAQQQKILRSQNVTSKKEHGGRRYAPYVFTEQGVAMLSSVLRSKRAVAVNIEIIRTFVSLRRLLDSHKILANKLSKLEEKYDTQFKLDF